MLIREREGRRGGEEAFPTRGVLARGGFRMTAVIVESNGQAETGGKDEACTGARRHILRRGVTQMLLSENVGCLRLADRFAVRDIGEAIPYFGMKVDGVDEN